MRNEKIVRSVVIIKKPFFLNLGDRKYYFTLFANFNYFMTRCINCENSLAVVGVEYKIPEVYCYHRKVMVL